MGFFIIPEWLCGFLALGVESRDMVGSCWDRVGSWSINCFEFGQQKYELST